MPEPLRFSLVVPVHNKGPHVARAIESVLAQSYPHFELLIIDDASTDDSLQAILKFEDERIRLLKRSTPGPGGYAARNLGVREAQHDWIAFLDADDEWTPEHLSRCADIIAAEPSARFIGAGFVYRDAQGEVLRVRCEPSATLFERADFGAILENMAFCVPTVVIRKELLISAGGFPEGQMTRGGDIDTWLRVMERSNEVLLANHCAAIVYLAATNRVTQTCRYTEDEIRNTALKSMIDRHQGELKKQLKKFYNQAIVFAWQQNWQLGVKNNFSLLPRLYYTVEPLKYLSLGLVSLLPGRLPYYIFCKMLDLKAARV